MNDGDIEHAPLKHKAAEQVRTAHIPGYRWSEPFSFARRVRMEKVNEYG